MSIVEEFIDTKFVRLSEFLSQDDCESLTSYLKAETDKNGWHDEQCPKSKALKNDVIFDKLLYKVLPEIEEVTGKKLLPTYSYARWYVSEEELEIHKDRQSCEYSVTLTLGFDGNAWPIYMGYPSDNKTECEKIYENKKVYVYNPTKIEMNAGDALVYKGCELYHWRDSYKEGNWQAQVFLHYVDANGPYKDWADDKLPIQKKVVMTEEDLIYWYYTDVMTHNDCDTLITELSKLNAKTATIGSEDENISVDKTIRNVSKIDLPTYKGVGAILTAVGIDANQQRWKFDIKKSNQCEFLNYPAGGGRYKGHIDTFLTNSPKNLIECRKLTVLAFLNDDFTGGKFFLQVGSERIYPPQSKGTVLVFPSFILHGVEDVIEGERYSVVTWLVGPWFK
jgi:predicted 2-oxoglutarate/Fe(II)-dependent dioxygenase YbiX